MPEGTSFKNGVVPAIGFCLVAALVSVSMVWIGLVMATVARGGELVKPLLGSLAWSPGVIAVFGFIAVRAIRRPR